MKLRKKLRVYWFYLKVYWISFWWYTFLVPRYQQKLKNLALKAIVGDYDLALPFPRYERNDDGIFVLKYAEKGLDFLTRLLERRNNRKFFIELIGFTSFKKKWKYDARRLREVLKREEKQRKRDIKWYKKHKDDPLIETSEDWADRILGTTVESEGYSEQRPSPTLPLREFPKTNEELLAEANEVVAFYKAKELESTEDLPKLKEEFEKKQHGIQEWIRYELEIAQRREDWDSDDWKLYNKAIKRAEENEKAWMQMATRYKRKGITTNE